MYRWALELLLILPVLADWMGVRPLPGTILHSAERLRSINLHWVLAVLLTPWDVTSGNTRPPTSMICAAEFRGLSPTLQMIDDEHVACMDLCDKRSCYKDRYDELSRGSIHGAARVFNS
jgi:hypothetical protein